MRHAKQVRVDVLAVHKCTVQEYMQSQLQFTLVKPVRGGLRTFPGLTPTPPAPAWASNLHMRLDPHTDARGSFPAAPPGCQFFRKRNTIKVASASRHSAATAGTTASTMCDERVAPACDTGTSSVCGSTLCSERAEVGGGAPLSVHRGRPLRKADEAPGGTGGR